jgi:hypothetical protein
MNINMPSKGEIIALTKIAWVKQDSIPEVA